MNDYQKQAKDFCKKYGVTIESYYTGHRKYFPDDKVPRATYKVVIRRNGREYITDFGQSWVDSYIGRDSAKMTAKYGELPFSFPYDKADLPLKAGEIKKIAFNVPYGRGKMEYIVRQSFKAPDEYTILAALQKEDPGTFEDFCANFGYDEDSRKALDIYLAVQKEWKGVYSLFSDCLDELQEIA